MNSNKLTVCLLAVIAALLVLNLTKGEMITAVRRALFDDDSGKILISGVEGTLYSTESYRNRYWRIRHEVEVTVDAALLVARLMETTLDSERVLALVEASKSLSPEVREAAMLEARLMHPLGAGRLKRTLEDARQ